MRGTVAARVAASLPAVALAAIVAAIVAVVLQTRSYRAFEPTRLKIVTTAQSVNGAPVRDRALDIVVADEEARLPRLTPPAVLILRLQTGLITRHSSALHVTWNDRNVGGITFGGFASDDADRPVRHDLALPADLHPRAGDTIRFRSDEHSAPWSVSYAEIANVHGGSHGFVDLVIVPAATTLGLGGATWLVPIAVLLLRLRPGPPPSRRRWRVLSAIATTLVAVLLIASIVSPFVSPFKIGLALKTTVEGALILCWSGAWRLCRDLRGRARDLLAARTGSPHTADVIGVSLFIAISFATMTLHNVARYDGNYSGLILLARQWAERAPVLAERPDIKQTLVVRDQDGGYDGQYMYLMAFDPLLLRYKDNLARYRDMVDAPPYRYGRIGFSLLTRVLSLNDPRAYPWTMVWLIVASHLVAALLVGAIAVHYGRHPAWALLYLAIPGLWMSMRTALPESIAGVGLLAGYLLMLKSRIGAAAVAFALSLLVRETGAILVVCFALWWLVAERRPRQAITLAAALVPCTLWRVYVNWRLFPEFGGEGLLSSGALLDVPFRGMIDVWIAASQGTYFDGAASPGRAAMAFTLVLIALALLVIAFWWAMRGKRADADPRRHEHGYGAAVHPLSWALAAYALLAVSLDYEYVWSYWGNTERTTYELFLLGLVALLSLGYDRPVLRRSFIGAFGMIAIYTVLFSDSARDLQALF